MAIKKKVNLKRINLKIHYQILVTTLELNNYSLGSSDVSGFAGRSFPTATLMVLPMCSVPLSASMAFLPSSSDISTKP